MVEAVVGAVEEPVVVAVVGPVVVVVEDDAVALELGDWLDGTAGETPVVESAWYNSIADGCYENFLKYNTELKKNKTRKSNARKILSISRFRT